MLATLFVCSQNLFPVLITVLFFLCVCVMDKFPMPAVLFPVFHDEFFVLVTGFSVSWDQFHV